MKGGYQVKLVQFISEQGRHVIFINPELVMAVLPVAKSSEVVVQTSDIVMSNGLVYRVMTGIYQVRKVLLEKF